MNVLLTGQWPEDECALWRTALAAAMPEARWLDAEAARREGRAVRAAVVANPASGVLAGWPGVELVQSLWAGVDRLLADNSVPAHLLIARMVDPALGAAMAETALWATLSLHRGFFNYQRQQSDGQWRQMAQRRAEDVCVLLLGLGEMGRAVASRIGALGYRVLGWRLRPGAVIEGVAQHDGESALWPLLSRADVVINLLPLTPETRGLLNRRFFAAMPRTAAVVNLARGAHVVDDDLLQALDQGQLRHAVLDVFHTEPLPLEHRYWGHAGVTLLPHVAALTDARSASAVVAMNLRALRDGRPLAHLVQRQRGY